MRISAGWPKRRDSPWHDLEREKQEGFVTRLRIAVAGAGLIAQVEMDEVTYWHVELERHDDLPGMRPRAPVDEKRGLARQPRLDPAPRRLTIADSRRRTHAVVTRSPAPATFARMSNDPDPCPTTPGEFFSVGEVALHEVQSRWPRPLNGV
jgi:hypothetical protein